MARAPKDPRPILEGPLQRLLADLCARTDELSALDSRAILPVAAAAHGRAAASVRSLDDAAKDVTVAGHRRRWELSLRPTFFLEGDAGRRLGTLVHELLHLDPRSPGKLLEERRHKNRTHEEHEVQARDLAARWLAEADAALYAPLAHDGELLMTTWRARPVPSTAKERFSDADVFLAPVRMVTPKARRSVWW
jgi:hypothetical protein